MITKQSFSQVDCETWLNSVSDMPYLSIFYRKAPCKCDMSYIDQNDEKIQY